jgi:hypothetical protein
MVGLLEANGIARDLRPRLAGALRFVIIFDVFVVKGNEFGSRSCSIHFSRQ